MRSCQFRFPELKCILSTKQDKMSRHGNNNNADNRDTNSSLKICSEQQDIYIDNNKKDISQNPFVMSYLFQKYCYSHEKNIFHKYIRFHSVIQPFLASILLPTKSTIIWTWYLLCAILYCSPQWVSNLERLLGDWTSQLQVCKILVYWCFSAKNNFALFDK